MQKRYSFVVTGRVQGVSFRANTLKKAIQLNLTGFVQNQPDGSVYCEAEGSEESLDIFEDWIIRGPVLSKVAKVDKKEKPPIGGSQFTITNY
jgi:acylphosphatase